MLYYHKIKKDEVITLKDNFTKYLSMVEDDPIIRHCLPKCVASHYLIIQTFNRDDTLVQKITIWTKHPKDYNYIDKDCIEGFPEVGTTCNKYNSLVYNIKSDINGKDQNQLQGEKDSDSRCGEGSVLYCRGNRPQFATGRHCNEASAQSQRTSVRGYQIHLSARRSEVLGSTM